MHFKLGKCDIYLVTNVLSQKKLSDQEAIKLYKLRWGVEVYQPECTSSVLLYKSAASD
jgi:hypothetical protein